MHSNILIVFYNIIHIIEYLFYFSVRRILESNQRWKKKYNQEIKLVKEYHLHSSKTQAHKSILLSSCLLTHTYACMYIIMQLLQHHYKNITFILRYFTFLANIQCVTYIVYFLHNITFLYCSTRFIFTTYYII